MYRVTASPDSARPATRRALRERARARAGAHPQSASSPAGRPATSGTGIPSSTAAAAAVTPAPLTAASLFDDQADAAPAAPPIPAASAAPRSELPRPVTRGTAPEASDPLDAEPLPEEPEFLRASDAALPPVPGIRRATAAAEPARVTAWADEKHPTTALAWLDPRTVGATPSEPEAAPALFEGARLKPGWRRARALVPVGVIVALCAAYVGGTLLVPLDNVAPTVQPAQVAIEPAPAATAVWPEQGSAAVTVQGLSPLASTSDRDEIASITKVVSVMMVLDELPLEPGEQGPSFEFTRADQREYWSYRRSNQSSLDVPVGGSLTEYQMLQGILLGSANNYIDRLSDELWGSDRGFADAAEVWLRDHGIEGISLSSPSGFDEDNVATPGSLLRLAEVAMRHPVFAEIVGTRSAEIPGVGTVTNTNRMLEDEGVIGVKTGTLSHWNLLTAKEVTVGDVTVRLFAAVLGQDSNADRLAVTRSLFEGVEKSLAEQAVSVPKGTVVGHVTTEWGERVALVTDADARVVLWNGASATATPVLELGERTTAGAEAGVLTVKGPIDSTETPVSLEKEIPEPSIWWRLTHPLELFGIDEA